MDTHEKELGNILRSVRKACNFSQAELSVLSGIHEDTIRRIENAHVIPKHETILLLAKVLKISAGKIYMLAHKNNNLMHRLELLTETVLENNPDCFEKEVTAIETLLEDHRTKNLMLDDQDFEKIESYLYACREFLLRNEEGLRKSAALLEKVLFKENIFHAKLSFKKIKTTYLDLMILILYGGVLGELDRINESTTVLKFCFEVSKSLKFESMTYTKLKLKLIYNLAYNYHKYDWHKEVIEITEEGILLAQKNHLMYHLPQLFYRKGIAEYYLNDQEYVSSLIKTLDAFNITDNVKLKNLYVEITKKVHGIDMMNLSFNTK